MSISFPLQPADVAIEGGDQAEAEQGEAIPTGPSTFREPSAAERETMLLAATPSTGRGALRAELVVPEVPLIARLLLGIFLKLAWIIVS